MPVDLPARKTASLSVHAIFEDAIAGLAVLCFAVAVAGLVSHTPHESHKGISVAAYEAMLLSP